jgi:hypothetical protein
MIDFTKPPPRGAFDYLLDGLPPKPRPPPGPPPEPIQPPPAVRLGGGPQRIHITVELAPPPKPKAPGSGFWGFLFWPMG